MPEMMLLAPRICRQGRDTMLTLRRRSSTVFTVRLDTKCCNMFAVIRHNWFHMEQRFRTAPPLRMAQWRSAAPGLGGRLLGAARRWLSPLGGR